MFNNKVGLTIFIHSKNELLNKRMPLKELGSVPGKVEQVKMEMTVDCCHFQIKMSKARCFGLV